MLDVGELQPLINYKKRGRDESISIPTSDHNLSLLYVIGTSQNSDRITFPVEGVDASSISLRAVQAV